LIEASSSSPNPRPSATRSNQRQHQGKCARTIERGRRHPKVDSRSPPRKRIPTRPDATIGIVPPVAGHRPPGTAYRWRPVRHPARVGHRPQTSERQPAASVNHCRVRTVSRSGSHRYRPSCGRELIGDRRVKARSGW
jgi:hypothetical protein